MDIIDYKKQIEGRYIILNSILKDITFSRILPNKINETNLGKIEELLLGDNPTSNSDITDMSHIYIKSSYEKVNILNILRKLYEFVSQDSSDEITKACKLDILNEYIRIARYLPDGNIRTSGYYIDAHDIKNLLVTDDDYKSYHDINYNMVIKRRSIGVGMNDFIYNAHDIVFTEDDKDKIYNDVLTNTHNIEHSVKKLKR